MLVGRAFSVCQKETIMKTRILISSSPKSLAIALADYDTTATVEAEYGDDVVEGSVITLAHHGPRAGNPVPCSRANDRVEVEVIGLSHIDLDALGGTLSLLGEKPDSPSFWELAAFVDVNGAHKLGESGASDKDKARLYAWWAYSEANKVYPPRDGSVADISKEVGVYAEAIGLILDDDWNMLADGQAWYKRMAALNKESFVGYHSAGVILRKSDAFVNVIYDHPKRSVVAKSVVAFNTGYKSVTVSLADPIEGVSCKDIVQDLWGPEAGGHDGIAGSPRGRQMTVDDAKEAYYAVVTALTASDVRYGL
jgi:hypothetical protein